MKANRAGPVPRMEESRCLAKLIVPAFIYLRNRS